MQANEAFTMENAIQNICDVQTFFDNCSLVIVIVPLTKSLPQHGSLKASQCLGLGLIKLQEKTFHSSHAQRQFEPLFIFIC